VVLVCCTCGWDIRGVNHLPAHSHWKKKKVRTSDGVVVWVSAYWPNDGDEVLDEWEGIDIAVDWRAVAYTLITDRIYDPARYLAGSDAGD
jgi:hypothetical protein